MKLPVLLAALLAGHLVFGLCRVPMATVARRAQEIADYQREGVIAYAMRTSHVQGAEVLARVQATTTPDYKVFCSGDSKGPLEFAPALLWPRPCIRVSAKFAALRPVPIIAGTGCLLLATADGLELR